MEYDKQKKLVELLLQKTEDRSIEWHRTISDEVFQISFPKSSVRVRQRSRLDDDEIDVVIEMINEEGVVADTFSDLDLSSDEQTTPQGNNWYRRMLTLFEKARRSALGSDKVLDDILFQLEDIPF